MSVFSEFVRRGSGSLAMPIATYPGANLIGRTVRDMAMDGAVQYAASAALQESLGTPASLTAMDLSVEAEAFGAEVRMERDEVPTVIGRRVSSSAEIDAMEVPPVGRGRTSVPLLAARLFAESGSALVLGGMIGPFSLAGRLFGVSESLELTLTEPDTTRALLERTTSFLTAFARAFREAGAHGIIVAEPTAGLLSPRGLMTFSSPYVRRIVEDVEDGRFSVILHNCGARNVHLSSVLASGVHAAHFGAPMDLPQALASVPEDVIVCGNLDPAAVFVGSSPSEIGARTRALAKSVAGQRNVVLSSGCDVPPNASLEGIRAFVDAASSSSRS
jgi:uroporphyrinogen decarboxylase